MSGVVILPAKALGGRGVSEQDLLDHLARNKWECREGAWFAPERERGEDALEALRRHVPTAPGFAAGFDDGTWHALRHFKPAPQFGYRAWMIA
jgi:hypothetical protein